jgi:hypothetical protein
MSNQVLNVFTFGDSLETWEKSLHQICAWQISQSLQHLQTNHIRAQNDQKYLLNQLRQSEVQFQTGYTNYQVRCVCLQCVLLI